ncbi:flagellin N-terminal helical region, partial [Izhakiella capsodis]
MISIFTNPSEMTSANALNRANKVLQSAMERLATGKRINSAADDAAGLQIATRLQGQSNGMTVAQQNISKASSMLQTAEGAFDEVTNILFRMKDLATQGADDTNGASDRDALQSEFTELNKELANILNNTRYGNEKLFSSAVSVTKPEKEVLPEVPKVPEVPKTPEVPKVVEGAPPLGEPQAFKLETLEYTDAWHDKVRLKLTAEDGSRIDKIFTRDDPDYLAVMVYCVNYSAMFQRGETIPPLELKYTRAESSPVKSDTPVLLKSAPADSSSVPWVSGGGTSASATTPRVSELSPIPRGEGGTPSVSDSSAKVDPAPTPESDSPSVVIETPGKLTKALQFQIGAGKDEVMKLDLSEQINDVALAIGELGVAGH